VSAAWSADWGAPEQAGAAAGQQPPGDAAEQDPFGDLFRPPGGVSAGSAGQFEMTAADSWTAEPGHFHPPPPLDQPPPLNQPPPRRPAPPRRAPPPGRRRKAVVAVLAVAALLAAGGVAAWLTTHRHHARPSAALSAQPPPGGTQQRTTGPSSGSATPSASTGAGSEQAQLTQLTAQIRQSAAARKTVVRATGAVGGCTMPPTTGIGLMNQAISQRQAVMNRLGSLPVNAIPNGPTLLADFKQVLQHSITADQDFIGWMQHIQNAGTCPVPTATDPSYQAAFRESSLAGAAKKNFLALWNPLASQFSQPKFTASQL